MIESELNIHFQSKPGAGAAGGIGFALLVLGAKMESGAKIEAEAANLEENIGIKTNCIEICANI